MIFNVISVTCNTTMQNDDTLKTECPHCNTIFKVTKPHLKTADGLVQCGQCDQIFNAEVHLLDTATASNTSSDAQAPLFDQEIHANSADLLEEYDDEDQEHDDDDDELTQEELTLRLLGKTPQKPWVTTGWLFSISLLILILAAQGLYIKRYELAENPLAAPYIKKICSQIPGCQISHKKDLSKIQLVSRNVYMHPNIENALMISAIIANSAPFSQPYPVLLISMSNVRGKVIAQRYFKPHEYLQNDINLDLGILADSTVSVNLAVLDPGNDALAFELDFL